LIGQAVLLPGRGRVLSAQVRYQVTVLLRTPRVAGMAVIVPALLLVVDVQQAKHSSRPATTAVLTSRVGGLVVFGMLTIAYMIYTGSLVIAREEGVLRRWRATPLPAGAYFAGRILAYVLLADIAGLFLLPVGVTMAGLHLTVGEFICLLIADTLGALTLAALGTAITPLLPSAQTAASVIALTFLPLVFLSGGFGAITALPHWLTTAVSYLPVQPVIDAVTQALRYSGGGLALMSARDFAVLAGWAAGCLLLSVRFFRWNPTRPAHARPAGTGNGALSGQRDFLNPR
jgi:ABC-2 type transport system permease protein